MMSTLAAQARRRLRQASGADRRARERRRRLAAAERTIANLEKALVAGWAEPALARLRQVAAGADPDVADMAEAQALALVVLARWTLGAGDVAQASALLDVSRGLAPERQYPLLDRALLTCTLAEQNRQAAVLELLNADFAAQGLLPIEPRDGGLPLALGNLRTRRSPHADVTEGPLVTVLMPAYNAADTIGYSLTSILEQTWRSLEVIVVDDGSDDGTSEAARRAAAGDPRVTIIRELVNRGCFATRNIGLAHARGDLVTVHDADDWAHGQLIEAQISALRRDPRAQVAWASAVRTRPDLAMPRPPGRFLTSLMFPRSLVEVVGEWDDARDVADWEFLDRLSAVVGPEAIVLTLPGIPLGLIRLDSSTLTGQPLTGLALLHHPLSPRRHYVESVRDWHASDRFAGDLPYRAGGVRPFRCPPVFGREPSVPPRRTVDVVLASDLSLPGGTVGSVMADARSMATAGHRVALLHHPRYLGRRSRDIDARVWEEVARGSLDLLDLTDDVTADLLLVRYPPSMETLLDPLPGIRARRTGVIVNSAPMRRYGLVEAADYDLEMCLHKAARLGGDPDSVPIVVPESPLMRTVLMDHHADAWPPDSMSPVDWLPTIASWAPEPRAAPRAGTRLRIGRHGRDDPRKWPSNPTALALAYPAEVDVDVLGGASSPERTLGCVPPHWTVRDWNTLPVPAFLAALDVYVYFVDDGVIDPAPRAILEALAAGLPVVADPTTAWAFGDAVLACRPEDVLEVITSLVADPRLYRERSSTGLAAVSDRFSPSAMAIRLERLRA
jgi:hypothetical protein